MKATWKPRSGVTGTPFVLGDNTAANRSAGSRVITSYLPRSQFNVQAASYAEAAAIETFGRRNAATEVLVTAACQFASFGECTKFVSGLADLVRFSGSNEGILEIRHTGGGADTMEGCIQSATPLQQVGSFVVIQYQFLGGEITRGQGQNL